MIAPEVTLSGEHLDVDIGRSSCVSDVRHACVDHFGLRARMGKLLLEEELLDDDQEIREASIMFEFAEGMCFVLKWFWRFQWEMN